jgi:hypothetical protein
MKNLILALVAVIVLGAGPAGAGSPCSERALKQEAFAKASAMALKLRQALDQSGAKIAIVGRVGSDISEHGLRYTHAGIVQRDHRKGRWVFVHLLNECGANSSSIYDQGLINFFLDDLFAYDAVIAIPAQALQDRLDTALNGATVARLHNPKYSMIAYPFSTRYQNSNQWVLEILAAAQAGGAVTREAAQKYLKDRGYTPDIIRISGFKRFGAALFRANVQFDDHPDSESENGRDSFVSVRSILRYLEQTGGMKTRTEIISQN